MKRNKNSNKRDSKISKDVVSAEQALQFLEDIRILNADVDETTVPISLRIPGNILRAIKLKAKADGKKYQSLIVEYLRRGLKSDR